MSLPQVLLSPHPGEMQGRGILLPTLRVGEQLLNVPASREVLTGVLPWTCDTGRWSVRAVRPHAERGNEDFVVLPGVWFWRRRGGTDRTNWLFRGYFN